MKCAEVAKTLNDIVGKHKKAELTMKILVQQVNTIKAAWDRIRDWSGGYQQNGDPESGDVELLRRLDQSLEFGDLVLSALEDDLASYREEGEIGLGFMDRSKTVWNESSLQDNQMRVRDQVLTMTLLLQVLSLPFASDRSTLLDASSVTLRKSDESAYSIVPSRMSVWSRRSSHTSVASSEMVYSRLKLEEETENELFASTVYKGNYRVPHLPQSNEQQVEREPVDTFSGLPSHTPPRRRKPARQSLSLDPDTALRSHFLDAVYNMNEAIVENYLLEGMDPNGPAQRGTYKAVHLAVKNDDLSAMKLLVSHGAFIDEQDGKNGPTPLHIPAARNNVPMTQYLLKKKARLDIFNDSFPQSLKGLPASVAAREHSFEILDLLREAGVTVDLEAYGTPSRKNLYDYQKID